MELKKLKSLTFEGLDVQYTCGASLEATDEVYFDITDDGVISLKPEYRGEVPAAAAGNAKYIYAVSDRGADLAGTLNHELPEEIVLPETVNGIQVTAYAYAMLMGNKRVKLLALPGNVKELPGHFCFDTWNLREVLGAESIETLSVSAFNNSGIRSANFPNLKQLSGKNHFQSCADMVSADLGNAITAIPEGCFFGCEKLAVLRNANLVTTVGKNGFMNTRRLKTLSFIPNLTSVGDYGFLISRITYDWNSLTGCTFGALSTPMAFCGEDYWSGCTFTPCIVPLRSTFSQLDPRWVDKKIGNLERIWHDGCVFVTMAMAYSTLEGRELATPEEFTDAVYAANPALKNVDPGASDEAVTQYLEAVGYQVDYYPDVNTASLQAVYNALAAGAVVIQHCIAGSSNGNHSVLVYGVNENGEMLSADPTAMTTKLGRYEASIYPMAPQNRMRAVAEDDFYKDYFWVVRKN